MKRLTALVGVGMLMLLVPLVMGSGGGCGSGGLKVGGGGRPTTPGGYIDRNFSRPATYVNSVITGSGNLDPVATLAQNPSAEISTNKASFKFGIYPAVPMIDSGLIQLIAVDITNPAQMVGSLTYLATANLGSDKDPCTLSEWSVTLPGPGQYGLTLGDDKYFFIKVK